MGNLTRLCLLLVSNRCSLYDRSIFGRKHQIQSTSEYIVLTLGFPRKKHLIDPKTMAKNDKSFADTATGSGHPSSCELYRLSAVGPSAPSPWLARCAPSVKGGGRYVHVHLHQTVVPPLPPAADIRCVHESHNASGRTSSIAGVRNEWVEDLRRGRKGRENDM